MLLPYVLFVFCMSKVISSFKSLRPGSQVFALLMLFLCVLLHAMWSRKSLQLLCILPFGMLWLSAISKMFAKIMLPAIVYVGLSESGHCVFRELCQVSFLVVVKVRRFCCSMYACRMLIVVMIGNWFDNSACSVVHDV